MEAVTLSLAPSSVTSTNLLFPTTPPGADIETSGLDWSRVAENVDTAAFIASSADSCEALAAALSVPAAEEAFTVVVMDVRMLESVAESVQN